MFTEDQLKAIYAANPFLSGYLAAMLQDLQMSEADEACTDEREERDSGTIYTLPAETFGQALADCEGFRRVADRDGALTDAAQFMTLEALGSDFHMTRVGHGVGYWERAELKFGNEVYGNCGDALTAAAELFRNQGGSFGDDGKVYL